MSKKKSTNVPCDILFRIFTRLPVKSLLRFQSVSKSWNAIISGYEFKKAFLDRSKALGRVKFLSQGDGDEFKFSHLKYLCVITQKQQFPLKGFEGAHILCSHDGLILLKRDRAYKKFVLWNPSTRQCQELASCPYVKQYAHPRACGLCYDSTTADYKVILIYNLFYVVWSNRNCWTRKTTLPILKQILPTIEEETELCSYTYPQGISVEGCVYWSLDRKLHMCVSRDSTIIYFDVKSDELKVLPTPDFIGDEELFRLTNLKGRLSLYGGKPSCNIPSEVIELDFWIMDGDGWKWLMKLRHIPGCNCNNYFVTHSMFLCCMGNGGLIFLGPGHEKVSIYYPKQQQFFTKEIIYCDVTCLDSLCFPKINVMHKRKRKQLTH